MSRKKELRRLTESWNNAWNSRDPEKLAALFTESGTYYDPDLPGEAVPGKEGIKACARKTWTEWPTASFEQVSITIDDPRVVLEWRSSAMHRSGVEVQLEGVDVLEWEGDHLSAVRVYYDEHRRRVKLGQK